MMKADAPDERVPDGEHGLERVVLRVEHRRVPESEQDAADTGHARREREGVELDVKHVDAQRRRRPLVGADGDQPATGAAPADVRDRERADHEQGEDEQRPPPGIQDGVEVDAEEALRPDRRAFEAACEIGVGKHRRRDGHTEAERHDSEIDAAGSQGGQSEDDAHEHRDSDPGDEREQERDVRVDDEPAGDERGDPAERELRQRELSGVPEQHDDGQQDDAPAQRHAECDHEFLGEDPTGQRGEDDERRDEDAPVDATRAQRRTLLSGGGARRQPLPAQHQQGDDDDERNGLLSALDVAEVARRQGLRDAERHRPGQRHPERRQIADQHRGEHGDDQQRHRVGRDPDEGRDEDAGHRRECASQSPGQRPEEMRRPPEGGRRARILGRRAHGEPDRAVPRPRPQRRGQYNGDAGEDQLVQADLDTGDVEELGRDLRADLLREVTPFEMRYALQQDQEPKCRHHAGQARGASQASHHEVVREDAQQAGAHDGGEEGHPERVPGFNAELPVQVRTDHRHRGVREVEDRGASVDQQDALGEQRVRRARTEAEDRELNDRLHREVRSARRLQRIRDGPDPRVDDLPVRAEGLHVESWTGKRGRAPPEPAFAGSHLTRPTRSNEPAWDLSAAMSDALVISP